ncbi:MAG: glycosyltransferase family 2 protein [Candidatus Edwardsbacteria bacterium]|nr:glycosyltransferase family 2 protein [Candidatus Edwardsbacteria bacterium]
MIRLTDLPAPPQGRTGWPWTEDCHPPPPAMANGSPWPRISIVTPSFNQGRFIEETIRSVLLQDYPDLEYMVIDGGSTDGTVEIIRKYASWLAYWVSEKDNGQSHAINKGMRRATGAIAAYINSDDYYLPGALERAADALAGDAAAALVYGDCVTIGADGARLGTMAAREFDLETMIGWFDGMPQASVFIRKAALDATGPFDVSLHYIMDYDMWLRLGLRYPLKRLPVTLAAMRSHEGSKTTGPQAAQARRFRRERFLVKQRALADPALPGALARKRRAILGRAARVMAKECLRAGDLAEAAYYLTCLFARCGRTA